MPGVSVGRGETGLPTGGVPKPDDGESAGRIIDLNHDSIRGGDYFAQGFARIFGNDAGAAGMLDQAFNSGNQAFAHFACCGGVIGSDIGNDVPQIEKRGLGPQDYESHCESCCLTWAWGRVRPAWASRSP